jgi:phosphoribosyl 1,2-cyclic phosphate phosphodiesterase
LRAAALICTDDATLLVDCGPDFRQQMLSTPFGKIDGVLITHEHYDHVGGLDDLRTFSRLGRVSVFAEPFTAGRIRTRMPYCFAENRYPGIPDIRLQEIEAGKAFRINATEVTPLRVMHGRLPILGYRIGKLAYITDMLTLPDETYRQLEGVELLVLNALRIKPHITHQSLDEALETARRINACETFLTHISHQMGLHAEVEKHLPPHVHLAYDGLEITY